MKLIPVEALFGSEREGKKIAFCRKMQYDIVKWAEGGISYDLQYSDLGSYWHPGKPGGGGVLRFQWLAGL